MWAFFLCGATLLIFEILCSPFKNCERQQLATAELQVTKLLAEKRSVVTGFVA
jgi:hypothetical protein